MLCHLMAYDRTKLSVSQTLRPSSRTPCVLRRKPSPRKELRRLSPSVPMLFLRGPVPSCRGHCSTSEARCPGRRASEPRPRPASRSPAASQDSCLSSEARCPGSQPGLLLLLRGPVPWPMLSRHLHVAKARLQPCQKCFFFGFLHAESRRTRDTFSASKT